VFSKSLIEQKSFKSRFKNRESLNRTVWTANCRQTVLKTGKHAYYYYNYYKGTDYSDASQKVRGWHYTYQI